jgi:hypothetical protein
MEYFTRNVSAIIGLWAKLPQVAWLQYFTDNTYAIRRIGAQNV